MKKIAKIFLGMQLSLFSLIASASENPNPPPTPPGTLDNPLKYNTLGEFIRALLNEAVIPIGGVLVVLAIIYCGFLFVTAQGNETKLQKAKTAFLWTVVGAAVLLGAAVLSDAVVNTIKLLKK